MKNKIIKLLGFILILLFFSVPAYSINVYIDGELQSFEGTIVNDRTMVPLRFISESLGSEVYWNGFTRSVEIFSDSFEKLSPDNLSIGMALAQAENILGTPKNILIGPANTELRSYHNNYSDYYLVSYKDNQIHYIFTSQKGSEFDGEIIGETYKGINSNNEFRKGSLTATFNSSEDKKVSIKDI